MPISLPIHVKVSTCCLSIVPGRWQIGSLSKDPSLSDPNCHLLGSPSKASVHGLHATGFFGGVVDITSFGSCSFGFLSRPDQFVKLHFKSGCMVTGDTGMPRLNIFFGTA